MTGIWLVLLFAIGVGTGVMWREAYELLTKKDDPVDLWRRLTKSRLPLLTIALITSMVFTGVVGIMLAVSNTDRNNLLTCITDYNTQVGDARDSRAIVADDLDTAEIDYVTAELRYQRGLLRTLEADGSTDVLTVVIRDRVKATEDYQAALERQVRVREAEPYPAPDLCQGK